MPPRPSDMASSLSDTDSLERLSLAPASPYTAGLPPLKGAAEGSPKAAALASDALHEQFERAQQYVARHPEDFTLERLTSLQAGHHKPHLHHGPPLQSLSAGVLDWSLPWCMGDHDKERADQRCDDAGTQPGLQRMACRSGARRPRARAAARMPAWRRPPCMCCRSRRRRPCGRPSMTLPSSGDQINPPAQGTACKVCLVCQPRDYARHARTVHAGLPDCLPSQRHRGLLLRSPDGMLRSVQACPSASMLADLKDCLDFCSNSWVSLFCRQGGTALLLQVCCAATSPDKPLQSFANCCTSGTGSDHAKAEAVRGAKIIVACKIPRLPLPRGM